MILVCSGQQDTMGTRTHIIFLTGLLLLSLIDKASAVKCYVCSWSPTDYDNDTCTTKNFNPQRIRTHECDAGCETVIMKDSNGELEMFYRNCYTDGNYIYIKENKKVNNEEKYKCNSRLCNTGSKMQMTVSPILLCGLLITSLQLCLFK